MPYEPKTITLQTLTAEFNDYRVPHRYRAGLVRYIIDGVLPGNFLRAVLANDFVGAAVRADDEVSMTDLRSLAKWVFNECPMDRWGDSKAVANCVIAKENERARQHDIDHGPDGDATTPGFFVK